MSTMRRDLFIDSSDHIMVGYRGVDGDVSLQCAEVVRVLAEAGDILDPEVIRQVAESFGACADRLARKGVDVRQYSPLAVAYDIEDARAALGVDKITLVGESFGTRIAYYYAVLFPEHVHRMVLIGPNPPGRMVWDPWQSDSLIGRYGELWKQDPVAMRRAPDLVDAIKRVHANYPKRWLFFPIHEGTVRAGMNSFLFQRETAAQVFDAYVAASQGDASGLWLFSFVGGRIFPDIVNWGDNAAKAMNADFDSSHDYFHELMPAGSVFGAPLGAFLWGAGQTGKWPFERIPERFRVVEQCSTETLMLAGSLDFSTPAVNAGTDLLPHLPRGHLVVMAEAGHVGDLWNLQPDATVHLLLTFVRRGSVDASRMHSVPMSFEVSWGFPVLAKLAIAGVLLVVVLIAWGTWKLARFWRRRRERNLAV
jgi:pimeloyl-ACP methyl ester carboxylesterase